MIKSEDEILKADGFDDAIIGRCARSGLIVYSYRKCVEILIKSDGVHTPMSIDDAVEYLDYNVLGAYMGEGTPIFVDDDEATIESLKNPEQELDYEKD